MNDVKMGEIYFKLDNTTETKEQLDNFFLELGFTLVKNKPLGSELFNRVSQFTNNDGLTFDVIWYKNLSHIRIGEWGKAFFENTFDRIVGSYIPNYEHITLDFMCGDKRTATLSVKK